MKYLTIFSSFLFLSLAACSSETQPPADQPSSQDEPEPSVQEVAQPPADISADPDEVPQMVEESNADAEDDTDADKPWVIGRQPIGRISIANSDAGAASNTDSAISQSYRAVQEVLSG